MKLPNSNFRSLYFILMIILGCASVSGQQNNSLYYMDRIPQSAQLNPAIQPKCGFYLGLPAFSSFEINGGNHSIGFLDIFTPNAVNDSLGLSNNLLKTLSTKNTTIYADLRQDWFSMGFRVNESYFTFSVSERFESNSILPGDLPRLIYYGNLSNFDPELNKSSAFDFSGLGMNATWYREYALGYSKEINDNLTFGLRGKLLFGKANVTTSNEFTLKDANVEVWNITSDIDLKSSVPGMNVYYSNTGKYDSVSMQKTKNTKDVLNTYNPRNNRGFGIDLGFVLKPSPKFSFSASLLDLGYINWKNNVNRLTYNGNISFKGMPASIGDSIDRIKSMVDTLKNISYEHNKNNYITTLTPKLYAGAHFQLVKAIGLGFLSRFQMMDKTIQSQYTFSLNLSSGNFLNTTFSYTLADGMTDNLGIALSTNFGPIQWYIASERVPIFWAKNTSTGSIPLIPEYYRNFNLHTGINLVFGYTRNRKLLKDKPLVAL